MELELADAAKQILPALEAVRLAPSAHNTQPWILALESGRSFRVSFDPRRRLARADPEGEVLGYSLGCAIETAASVAHLEFEPNASLRLTAPWTDVEVGRVLVERLRDDLEEASEAVRRRRTHRAAYARERPTAEQLRRLTESLRPFAAELGVLDDPQRMRQLSRLTVEGAVACLNEPAYLEELLEWIRRPDAEPDGFTAATLGIDPATFQIVEWMKRSPFARRLVPRLGLVRAMAWQAGNALSRSGALLMLAADGDTAQARVRAGRALAALWLAATRVGLVLQPVHFPITLDSTRAQVMSLFGAEPSWRAVSVLRVGVARRVAPASARLPLERICVVDGSFE